MTTLHRRRNPVAQAAILRKGGVHEKSRKAKRQKQKNELRKTVSKAMATYSGHYSFWLRQNRQKVGGCLFKIFKHKKSG